SHTVKGRGERYVIKCVFICYALTPRPMSSWSKFKEQCGYPHPKTECLQRTGGIGRTRYATARRTGCRGRVCYQVSGRKSLPERIDCRIFRQSLLQRRDRTR